MLFGFQFYLKKRVWLYLALMMGLILISACQPATAAATPTAAEPEETPITETAPTVQAQPTAAPQILLSEQAYASPSGAFEIYLPKDWNCSETGQLSRGLPAAERQRQCHPARHRHRI